MSTELTWTLVALLVAVVGYFLNKWITAIDTVVEKLTSVVADLKTTVALLQLNQTNFSASDAEKHRVIDSRFDSHSKKLHEYGERILKIETHKNYENIT